MFSIISRIMEGSTVSGYVVTDGTNRRYISKEEAWNLAKSNQIQNVKAIGNSPEQGLTGTNGFELKKLPTEQVNNQIDAQVYTASIIRHAHELPSFNVDKEIIKTVMSADLQSGLVNKYTLHALSNSLCCEGMLVNPTSLVDNLNGESVIYDGDKDNFKKILSAEGNNLDAILKELVNYYNRLIKRVRQLKDKVTCVDIVPPLTTRVVGYKIRNIGNEPIQFVTVNQSTFEQGNNTIMPGQVLSLTRIETALLMANPYINGRISNAKIFSGNPKPKDNAWQLIGSYYLGYSDSEDEREKSESKSIILEENKQLKKICIFEEKDYMRFVAKDDILKIIGKLARNLFFNAKASAIITKYSNILNGIYGGATTGTDQSPKANNKSNPAQSLQKLQNAKGMKGFIDAFSRK